MYNPNLHFHFIGIGGSGMSGIAEILLRQGFSVSGSDLNLGSVCERLQGLGAVIFQGHCASHVPENCSLIVYSSAVSNQNPEFQEGVKRNLPVIRRAEVLAELMRMKFGVAVAGSHGKTSTTSMVASIMEAAEMDPTVIIGGRVKNIGSGGKLGNSEFLVAESDESDRSFLLLKPTIAVVTNIDLEHLESYSSVQDLEQSFYEFVSAVPFYGLAVLCADDLRVKSLIQKYSKRKITYGFTDAAEIQAVDFTQIRNISKFSVKLHGKVLGQIELPLPGKHFAANCLAAIAVALEFGIEFSKIADAIKNFGGVERRLEIIGEFSGATIINDYGHHPAEVKASIAAVRAGWKSEMKKLKVIFQPHRYSRTKACLEDFKLAFVDADELYITDIYPAGEQAIEGISGKSFTEVLQHNNKHYIDNLNSVIPKLKESLNAGDVVLFLGAGSIGTLPSQLMHSL